MTGLAGDAGVAALARAREEAAARAWDAAVIGAGPAGALAARQLARAGLSVVLVDKSDFPRDKVCGCCLSAAALSTLAGIGLGELPCRLGAAPIATLELAAGRARASLPIRGAALSRSAFDMALVREAVASGACFLPRTLAAIDATGRLQVRESGGDAPGVVRAQTILVADGLGGSVLAGRPDLAPRVRPGAPIGASTILSASTAGYGGGAIHMTVGPRGYVGAVRLQDGRLNIAAALAPGFIREARGPGRAIALLLAGAGMPPVPEALDARFHATPMLTRRRPVLESGPVLILGDAAGYVEPFTGEGIAWALAAAVSIVPAVLLRRHGCHVGARAASHGTWPRVYHRQIAPRQHLCRALAWTLRRERLASVAVRVLGLLPGAARPALHRVALPYPLPEAVA